MVENDTEVPGSETIVTKTLFPLNLSRYHCVFVVVVVVVVDAVVVIDVVVIDAFLLPLWAIPTSS